MNENKNTNPWSNTIWLLIVWIWFWILWFFYSRDKANLGTWWDSFWVINALTSIVVLYFVYSSYLLQKKELVDTRLVLVWQENAMIEQRFQDTFTLLLKTSEGHLNNMVISVQEQKRDDNLYKSSFLRIASVEEKAYFELSWWAAVIYLVSIGNLSEYVWTWAIWNFKKYINTLWILENLIELNVDKIDKDFYIKLAKTQINEAEKRLFHNLKFSFKKMDLYDLKYLMNYKEK